MKRMGPVVAAVNQTERADVVLQQAHERALAAGVPLVVCHVLPSPLSNDPLFPQNRSAEALAAMDREAQAYGQLVERVGRVTRRKRAEYTVVHPVGDVASGISGLADQLDASLVVVGPGLTAVLVVRQSGGPVLVAREGAEGCVLGTTDFTDPEFPALARAAEEARRMDRPLCFFHALRPVENLIRLLPDVVSPSGVVPRTEEEKERAVTDVCTQLRRYAQELHTPAEALATVGSPSSEIPRLARYLRAQLLVVATPGRSGLLRFLRGSVAETTILSAPCSVLVVRKAW